MRIPRAELAQQLWTGAALFLTNSPQNRHRKRLWGLQRLQGLRNLGSGRDGDWVQSAWNYCAPEGENDLQQKQGSGIRGQGSEKERVRVGQAGAI